MVLVAPRPAAPPKWKFVRDIGSLYKALFEAYMGREGVFKVQKAPKYIYIYNIKQVI